VQWIEPWLFLRCMRVKAPWKEDISHTSSVREMSSFEVKKREIPGFPEASIILGIIVIMFSLRTQTNTARNNISVIA